MPKPNGPGRTGRRPPGPPQKQQREARQEGAELETTPPLGAPQQLLQHQQEDRRAAEPGRGHLMHPHSCQFHQLTDLSPPLRREGER